MVFLWIFLAVILLLVIAFLFSIRGRRGHALLPQLRQWHYAHRGLHNEARPENSMSAFRAALEKGYGIELDVHLMRDGNLAVIHDSLLQRTTGAQGRVEDLTEQELPNYHLEGTSETIPTLKQVLQLFDGKAPMIIELKTDLKNGVAPLVNRVMAELKDYEGLYCIESFDPRCVHYLKKHYPQVVRGQLTDYFMDLKNFAPWFLRFALTHSMANFLTKPDFLACSIRSRGMFTSKICKKLWHVQGVCWTVQDLKTHQAVTKDGWMSIFENFEP